MLILGIFLLIVGVMALGFAGVAYEHYIYNSQQMGGGWFFNNTTNQLIINEQLADSMIGLLIGTVFFMVGLMFTIVGSKDKIIKK